MYSFSFLLVHLPLTVCETHPVHVVAPFTAPRLERFSHLDFKKYSIFFTRATRSVGMSMPWGGKFSFFSCSNLIFCGIRGILLESAVLAELIAFRLPKWRNGRRTRLKIWRPRGHEGSSPSFGTILQLKKTGDCPKSAPYYYSLPSPKTFRILRCLSTITEGF